MKNTHTQERPTKACFRFAPDILRRLGEELNPSVDQGVIELVKNAYDADARVCKVEFMNTDQVGGLVRVADDGDGMGASEIVDGWLVLGSSQKASSRRTRLGRVPAGNKGLGRLAALRMGRKCALISRPRNEPDAQYHLCIDWNRYDRVRVVEEVVHTIIRHRRPAGTKAGSEIEVGNLKELIGRMDLKRLARAMILLADPFGDDPKGFKPALIAPEFSDIEALVQKRYFEEAEYHLAAVVDQSGRARAAVLDWDCQGRRITPHSLSAVVRLLREGMPVALFPGDLDDVGLDDLIQSGVDARSPILIYPHHGGWSGASDEAAFVRKLCALVQPITVAFSIARGRHSTPRPEIIEEVRQCLPNVRIACTQLSEHCATNVPKHHASHLTRLFAVGRHVRHCCAGTMLIPLDTSDTLVLPILDDHRDFISSVASTALCMRPIVSPNHPSDKPGAVR